jgi:hypothetical protein
MYFLQSGYAIVRFASEKHSENKWHFLLFSGTFPKVQGSWFLLRLPRV